MSGHAWGTVAHPLWSLPAPNGPTCRVLRRQPWPFLPPPGLDHPLVPNGSRGPDLIPGSRVRRAGVGGSRGPCSTSGHLWGSGRTRLSQPHRSPHRPIGQADPLDVSSSELHFPRCRHLSPSSPWTGHMRPLLRRAPARGVRCVGSAAATAPQDADGRTSVGGARPDTQSAPSGWFAKCTRRSPRQDPVRVGEGTSSFSCPPPHPPGTVAGLGRRPSEVFARR